MIFYSNIKKKFQKKSINIVYKKVKMILKFEAFNGLKLIINSVIILLTMKVKYLSRGKSRKQFEYKVGINLNNVVKIKVWDIIDF